MDDAPTRDPPPGDVDLYPFLRLVKLRSDVLPRDKTVAIVDGRHGGISVGRDRTYTPRLRLPSMEVSKHHANIFSNSREPYVFSVADTGSTHGTFVCRRGRPTAASALAQVPSNVYQRLSEAKQASQPFALQHWDLLRIGQQSTTFEVHLHDTPYDVCDKCAIQEDGRNEISLAPLAGASSVRGAAAPSVLRPSTSQQKRRQMESERRSRLKALRHACLARVEPGPAAASTYRDRAAVRRELHDGAAPMPPPSTATTTESAPSRPLGADHVGYQMLARMASSSETPLPTQAPVVPRVAAGRAGLGSTGLLDAEAYAQSSSQRYQAQGRATARQRYEAAAPK